MRNVTSNFLLWTPGYKTGIMHLVIKEMKILKGMVFLLSLTKFFFCCRAKVFLFLKNLKCTGVLTFTHHLYFYNENTRCEVVDRKPATFTQIHRSSSLDGTCS